MNIGAVMDRAGDNLVAMCSPERDWLPYWQVREDGRHGRLWFRGDGCNAHNIGRFLDAMLALEAVTGYRTPAEVEAGMLRNLRAYTDNPWKLLLDVADDPEDIPRRYVHSFRETMLAYAALVRRRSSRDAARDGERCVAAMEEVCADPASPVFRPARDPRTASHPCYFHGRAIEGLVRFAEAAGSERALALATRLADWHLDRVTRPDGALGTDTGNHMHSYLNTLRGLLLTGLATGRRDLVERVRLAYRSAVASLITPSGFITHDIDTRSFALGDAAAAGDVAQLALWLGRAGSPGFYDDVERIVRARLVPSQIVDPPAVEPRDPDSSDETRCVAERMRGAVGGAVGHTWGKSCVTDMTAAALHSLVDIARSAVEDGPGGVRVLLHLDADLPGLRVRCERGERAHMTVEGSFARGLEVRLPAWVPRETVEVRRDGSPLQARAPELGVVVPPSASRCRVEIRYELPERVTREESRTQFYHRPERPYAPAEVPFVYTFRWRGDEVVAADPVGDYQPLYARR